MLEFNIQHPLVQDLIASLDKIKSIRDAQKELQKPLPELFEKETGLKLTDEEKSMRISGLMYRRQDVKNWWKLSDAAQEISMKCYELEKKIKETACYHLIGGELSKVAVKAHAIKCHLEREGLYFYSAKNPFHFNNIISRAEFPSPWEDGLTATEWLEQGLGLLEKRRKKKSAKLDYMEKIA